MDGLLEKMSTSCLPTQTQALEHEVKVSIQQFSYPRQAVVCKA